MIRWLALTGALLSLPVTACSQDGDLVPGAIIAPVPTLEANEGPGLKTAIFAGGCFWTVEAVFSQVRGVTSVVSGYHGSARYDLVTSGITDHVEAVKITYDPAIIRYDQLMQIFFSVIADPTSRDQQGPDEGPEYAAQIVPVSERQHIVADAYLAQVEASGKWSAPVVTPIARAQAFYPAERAHQDFAARHPRHSYIERWGRPKVDALKRFFPRFHSAAFQLG